MHPHSFDELALTMLIRHTYALTEAYDRLCSSADDEYGVILHNYAARLTQFRLDTNNFCNRIKKQQQNTMVRSRSF